MTARERSNRTTRRRIDGRHVPRVQKAVECRYLIGMQPVSTASSGDGAAMRRVCRSAATPIAGSTWPIATIA
jgi:hypothetical protein